MLVMCFNQLVGVRSRTARTNVSPLFTFYEPLQSPEHVTSTQWFSPGRYQRPVISLARPSSSPRCSAFLTRSSE